MEAIWFIEIEHDNNGQIVKSCFKTICNKQNTAMNRAWKWCDKNCNIVHDIFITRIQEKINFKLEKYKPLNFN